MKKRKKCKQLQTLLELEQLRDELRDGEDIDVEHFEALKNRLHYFQPTYRSEACRIYDSLPPDYGLIKGISDEMDTILDAQERLISAFQILAKVEAKEWSDEQRQEAFGFVARDEFVEEQLFEDYELFFFGHPIC